MVELNWSKCVHIGTSPSFTDLVSVPPMVKAVLVSLADAYEEPAGLSSATEEALQPLGLRAQGAYRSLPSMSAGTPSPLGCQSKVLVSLGKSQPGGSSPDACWPLLAPLHCLSVVSCIRGERAKCARENLKSLFAESISGNEGVALLYVLHIFRASQLFPMLAAGAI